MKSQLDRLLADRAPVERGGYRIITTLDMSAQGLAERYITAGTVLTNMSRGRAGSADRSPGPATGPASGSSRCTARTSTTARWCRSTRGPATSWPTSAAPATTARTWRRRSSIPSTTSPAAAIASPGSAWKPIVYSAGFDAGAVTPGTLLPDVTTEFSRDWFPRDADQRERGPVLMRDALSYSLNIPTIRALDRIGVETVASLAKSMGLTFPRGDRHLLQAGLAGALGTAETNMVELTGAYGALANNGVEVEPRTILEIRDSQGNIVPSTGLNAPRQVVSQQTAWLMTDILKDSTDPLINTIFGPRLQVVNGPVSDLNPKGERRPAAAKTGTTNDLRDLSVYGYLPVSPDPDASRSW